MSRLNCSESFGAAVHGMAKISSLDSMYSGSRFGIGIIMAILGMNAGGSATRADGGTTTVYQRRTNWSASSGAVLFVAHLFQPVDGLSIKLFLNRDVRHRRCRRRAMPVLLAG